MRTMKNSITRYFDEYSVATRVRQLRSEYRRQYHHSITIVVVEGATDPLIYQSLFSNSRCHVEPAHGKKNAIRAIGILKKDDFQGVLAIVDDDFDTLSGIEINDENVITTDTHDIENLILISNALDKLLLHLLPEEKRKYQTNLAKDTRKNLERLCIPLGYLRWLVHDHNPPVDFSSINHRNFIDHKKLSIDIAVAVRELLSKNVDCQIVENELYEDLQRTIADRHDDYWVVCQGHDLLKILCLIFPRLLSTYEPSSKNEKDLYYQSIDPFIGNEKNLMKHLAMCYEMSDFEQTKMHTKIRYWEANNQPYIVLRI